MFIDKLIGCEQETEKEIKDIKYSRAKGVNEKEQKCVQLRKRKWASCARRPASLVREITRAHSLVVIVVVFVVVLWL